MTLYAGADNGEAFEFPLAETEGVDYDLVTDAVLRVRRPDGTRVEWGVEFVDRTNATMTLRHVFAETGADVNLPGTYSIHAYLTMQDGGHLQSETRALFVEDRYAIPRNSALTSIAAASAPSAPQMRVQVNGVSVPLRSVINFSGAPVAVSDDPVNRRTDVVISAPIFNGEGTLITPPNFRIGDSTGQGGFSQLGFGDGMVYTFIGCSQDLSHEGAGLETYMGARRYISNLLLDTQFHIDGDFPGYWLENLGFANGRPVVTFHVAEHTNFAMCGRRKYATLADMGGGEGVMYMGPAVFAPTQGPTMGATFFIDPADGHYKAIFPGNAVIDFNELAGI